METFTDGQFDGTTLRRPGRWVVAFLADWCPFCQRFRGPLVAWRPPTGVRAAIADLTDLDSPLWDRFAIEVVPTVMGFRDGTGVGRRDGIAGRGLSPRALDELASELNGSAHQ